MSHQVQIDYEAIAIRCESICEVAEKQIAELDQILSDIENGSQSLRNSQTAALQQLIVEERDSLVRKIENLKSQAKEVAKKGVVSGASTCAKAGTGSKKSGDKRAGSPGLKKGRRT